MIWLIKFIDLIPLKHIDLVGLPTGKSLEYLPQDVERYTNWILTMLWGPIRTEKKRQPTQNVDHTSTHPIVLRFVSRTVKMERWFSKTELLTNANSNSNMLFHNKMAAMMHSHIDLV